MPVRRTPFVNCTFMLVDNKTYYKWLILFVNVLYKPSAGPGKIYAQIFSPLAEGYYIYKLIVICL